MSSTPPRPDMPDQRLRSPNLALGFAVAGIVFMAMGVATNLLGSIKCAFGEGRCGQGTEFLLLGAIAFVLSGMVVGWSAGRLATGALVAVCGVASALLMRAFWTTSGPWLFISAIPAVLVTWRVLFAPPVDRRRPD